MARDVALDAVATAALAAMPSRFCTGSGLGTPSHSMPRHTDGRRLCKLFCRGECDGTVRPGLTPCPFAHVAKVDRPPCPHFTRVFHCPAGDACWFPHVVLPPRPSTLAVKCAWMVKERVIGWFAAAAPWLTCEGVYADTPERKSAALVLFSGGRAGDALALALGDALLLRFLDKMMVLGHAAPSLPALAAELLSLVPGGSTARLQVSPPRVIADVQALFADGTPLARVVKLQPARFELAVHVAFAGGHYYYGILQDRAVAQVCVAPAEYIAEQTRQGRLPPLICRAQLKMEEILRTVPLQATWNCLDIGASPGGWVTQMHRHAGHVAADAASRGLIFAVDPGAMHADVPATVLHLRKMAEVATVDVQAALGPRGRLHFVCCDANASPLQVVALVLGFQDLMAPHAFLAVTFKDFCPAGFVAEMKQAAAELARAQWRTLAVLHLLGNTDTERTLIAERMVSTGDQ